MSARWVTIGQHPEYGPVVVDWSDEPTPAGRYYYADARPIVGVDVALALVMGAQEAHDVHHALSIAVTLLQEVGAQPGAALTAESEERLARVARRLDHERHVARQQATA